MSEDPIIDLRRLRVLREVERRGTISAAAATLHLTPSAVSQQLAGLARDLDVPLLEREGRGVRLTGQARVLLAHAEIVEGQLDRARADLANWSEGTAGTVRVGALSNGHHGTRRPGDQAPAGGAPRARAHRHRGRAPECLELLDAGDLDIVMLWTTAMRPRAAMALPAPRSAQRPARHRAPGGSPARDPAGGPAMGLRLEHLAEERGCRPRRRIPAR